MVPTVVNAVEAWHLLVVLVIIIGGYLTHELLHIIVLELFGIDYTVHISPSDRPLLVDVTTGRAVLIDSDGPAIVEIASMLAPGLLTLPGWYYWIQIVYADRVGLSTILLVGAWIAIFMPSPIDWLGVYRQLKLLGE
jgi:hypothetical protein